VTSERASWSITEGIADRAGFLNFEEREEIYGAVVCRK
jgi:hypothetical protein